MSITIKNRSTAKKVLGMLAVASILTLGPVSIAHADENAPIPTDGGGGYDPGGPTDGGDTGDGQDQGDDDPGDSTPPADPKDDSGDDGQDQGDSGDSGDGSDGDSGSDKGGDKSTGGDKLGYDPTPINKLAAKGVTPEFGSTGNLVASDGRTVVATATIELKGTSTYNLVPGVSIVAVMEGLLHGDNGFSFCEPIGPRDPHTRLRFIFYLHHRQHPSGQRRVLSDFRRSRQPNLSGLLARQPPARWS
jgi:hypothetical protein